MFDLFQRLSFGLQAKAHGKDWILLHQLRAKERIYLAVEADALFPGEVKVIQLEPESKLEPVETEGKEN